MDAIVSRAVAPWRFSVWMFTLFAVFAFALATVGLFSLVSLDDTWITSAARPSLTSVQTPYEATGTIAVRVLHELVMTGRSPAGTTFLPAELIVRSSTGPAPAGGSPALRTAANT